MNTLLVDEDHEDQNQAANTSVNIDTARFEQADESSEDLSLNYKNS